MRASHKLKAAMAATTALIAAASALAPAQASDFDVAAYPAVIEAPVVAPVSDAVEIADQDTQKPVKLWALWLIAGGLMAGLIKLVGAKKVARTVAANTVKAAAIVAKSGVGAVRALDRAAGSPLRFAALMTGLALFAFTGVSLFDIEWAGGLIVGGAMALISVHGALKIRKALQPTPAKRPRNDSW